MNNCPRCKLNIKDDALVCPLCHGVIKREHAKDFANGNENPHENKIVDTKDLFPSENESGVIFNIPIMYVFFERSKL